MENEILKKTSLADIGQKLLDHSKEAKFSATRGAVVELFPYIFAANERLSARAIGRFLETEQGIKLSPATITKALNDPKKSWNAFFDTIEPYVKEYEKEEKSAKREEFLFNDAQFKKIEFPGREFVRKRLLNAEFAQAIDFLREKWFSISYETRVKALPYLAERLLRTAK